MKPRTTLVLVLSLSACLVLQTLLNLDTYRDIRRAQRQAQEFEQMADKQREQWNELVQRYDDQSRQLKLALDLLEARKGRE